MMAVHSLITSDKASIHHRGAFFSAAYYYQCLGDRDTHSRQGNAESTVSVPRKHLEDYRFHLTFFNSLLKTGGPGVAGCHCHCNEGKLRQPHDYGLKVCFHHSFFILYSVYILVVLRRHCTYSRYTCRRS